MASLTSLMRFRSMFGFQSKLQVIHDPLLTCSLPCPRKKPKRQSTFIAKSFVCVCQLLSSRCLLRFLKSWYPPSCLQVRTRCCFLGVFFTCLYDKTNDFCCLFLADIFVFSSEFNYIPLAALRVQQEGEGPIYFCFVNT